MTKKEKWIVDEDDELRLFYGDENFNGSAYPCNDIVFMKMIANKLNKLEDENEELKQFKSKVFDMIEAFINGIKDEKGIDENNQQFQAEMDRALKYMKAIKRELEKDD